MALARPELFFAHVGRGILGPKLDQDEVDGCNAVLKAMEGSPLAWAAYALATAFLETAGTMQPVREAFWLSDAAASRYFLRMYDIVGARPKNARELGNLCAGDGAQFCGRGYVQLTGRSNYAKAAAKLGVPDLVVQPAKAMEPEIAARIMRCGMEEGWFTAKRLADYLPRKGAAARAEFHPARRIINGLDRASDVAGFALDFQGALQAGGWS